MSALARARNLLRETPYRQSFRWFLVFILASVVTGSASEAFGVGAFLLMSIPLGLAALSVVVPIGFGVVMAWRRRASLVPAVAALTAPVGFALAGALVGWTVMGLAASATDWIVLTSREPAYRALIAKAQQGDLLLDSAALVQRSDGVPYLFEPGPPVRMAFPLGDGLTDNWKGFVYDPTDKVVGAVGFTRQGGFTAPPGVRELLGGDLVSCHLMRDHFYLCSFT